MQRQEPEDGVTASQPEAKRQKTEEQLPAATNGAAAIPERVKGITPIKPEYLIVRESQPTAPEPTNYDDEAEGGGISERAESSGQVGDAGKNRKSKRKETRGQNKNRKMIQPKDTVKYCDTINTKMVQYFLNTDSESAEEPTFECTFGERCRFEHDIGKYLASKPEDIPGVCPVYEAIGYCPSGLKCRWLHSHYIVRAEAKLGQLTVNKEQYEKTVKSDYEVNRVPANTLNMLQRKKFDFPLSTQYIKYLDARVDNNKKVHCSGNNSSNQKTGRNKKEKEEVTEKVEVEPEATEENFNHGDKQDQRATFVDPPFLPSEKRKINLDRKYIVSPLTTVGNLPYRRLMKTLGADVTYCEMALALPLVTGHKSEWALPRAHSSEIGKFGVQITAAKHWQAIKAAEAISKLTEPGSVQEINLNSGCPIDLVYRSGAGSALMDNASRMVRILEGMNAVSGDIPVTVKIRTGTRDDKPTAKTLVPRLVAEGQVAAITIHGRSRQQRYTKLADWNYIGEVAKVVKDLREETKDEQGGRYVSPWIVGNGDVYSWEDWYRGVEEQGVDSIMVARGALIKPWIFEEIEARQHLDKTGTERLAMLQKYAQFGLEHWGSDEYGVNLTRRYMCEFLSFTHRYVPVGILAHLPAKINDRPPPWQGRDETETLLGSSDYRDWIKITEMFLGKASDAFDFTPKHKSNSYANTNTGSSAAAAPEDVING